MEKAGRALAEGRYVHSIEPDGAAKPGGAKAKRPKNTPGYRPGRKSARRRPR